MTIVTEIHIHEAPAEKSQPAAEPRPLQEFNPDIPVREVRMATCMVGGSTLCLYENGVTQELYSMVQGYGVYALLKRLTQSHAYVDVLSGTSAGGINSIFLSAALAQGRDFRPTREIWTKVGNVDLLLQKPSDKKANSLLKGDEYLFEELKSAFKVISESRPTRPAPLPSGRHGELFDSHGGDLDLFITSTFLEGRPTVFFDARNQPIFSTNHRGVFHLKHRPEQRESHFDPALDEPRRTGGTGDSRAPQRFGHDRSYERLARIARATSSLPGVFEPATIESSLMNGVIELPADGAYTTVYMGDGGYLNNRPLDLVLKEVFRRPEAGGVVRKILLVDPDSEIPKRPSGPPTPPTALQHLWQFNTIRGTQSLASTLEEIYQHNVRARTVRETLNNVRARAAGTTQTFPAEEKELWRSIRRLDLRDRLISCWLREEKFRKKEGVQDHDPAEVHDDPSREGWAERLRVLRSSLALLLEPHPRGAKRRASEQVEVDAVDLAYLERKIRRVADEIYERIDPDPGYGNSARKRLDAAHQHVLGQRLMRLHELRHCVASLQESADRVITAIAQTQTFRRALDAGAAGADPATVPGSVAQLWQTVREAVTYALAAPGGLTPAELASPERLHDNCERWGQAIRSRAEEISKRFEGGESGVPQAWGLGAADSGTRIVDWIAGQVEQILREAAAISAGAGGDREARDPLYWAEGGVPISTRLDVLDACMLPVERAAALPNVNTVELVQIGAGSVRTGLCSRNAEHKLAGEGLGHLAGFLRNSWRANDIFWGRLDGAAALIETLLDRERIVQILRTAPTGDPGDPADIKMLGAIDAFLLRGRPLGDHLGDPPADDDHFGTHVRTFYVGDGGEASPRERIRKWLRGWTVGEAVPDHREEQGFRDLLDCLVLRCQLEILEEEVPRVLGAALAENAEWHAGAGRTGNAGGLARNRVDRELDALDHALGRRPDSTSEATLTEHATSTVESIFRKPAGDLDLSRLSEFFRTGYHVGTESWDRDIPPLVNARRGLILLRVFLNVLNNSLPSSDQAGLVQKLRTGLTPVSWIARALQTFVEVLEQGGAVAATGHAVAWSAMLLGTSAAAKPQYFGGAWFGLATAGLIGLLFELVASWAQARVPLLVGRVLALIAVVLGVWYQFWTWDWVKIIRADGPPLAFLGAALLAAPWLTTQPWARWAQTVAVVVGLPAALTLITANLDASTAAGLHVATWQWPGLWSVALVFTVPVLLAALGYMNAATKEVPEGSNAVLRFEFVGNEEEAERLVKAWTPEQREAIRRSLIRDFLYIPVYTWGTWLVCQMAAGAYAAAQPFWFKAGLLLGMAQIATLVLDVVENVALLRLLPKSGTQAVRIGYCEPRVATLAALLKWTLVTAGLFYAIVTGVIQAGLALARFVG